MPIIAPFLVNYRQKTKRADEDNNKMKVNDLENIVVKQNKHDDDDENKKTNIKPKETKNDNQNTIITMR